ncbi:hypothetical protein D3C85_1539850 [compost metagenome]
MNAQFSIYLYRMDFFWVAIDYDFQCSVKLLGNAKLFSHSIGRASWNDANGNVGIQKAFCHKL